MYHLRNKDYGNNSWFEEITQTKIYIEMVNSISQRGKLMKGLMYLQVVLQKCFESILDLSLDWLVMVSNREGIGT